MKYLKIAICILILTGLKPAFGQVLVSGGLGIDLTNNQSLNDYLSVLSSERRPDFSTNAEFFGEADFIFSGNHAVGIEYAMAVNSYSNSVQGLYELSWVVHMPSALYFYMLNGPGYKFKFGGGAGYRLAKVEESRGFYIFPESFSASGFGFLLRAEGNTSLGGNLYALIAAQLRWDFTGELKNDERALQNPVTRENVDLNSFSIGLRLGVSYYF